MTAASSSTAELRLDAEANELVEERRLRVRRRLGSRERVASLLVGGAFFAAAIPLAFVHSSHSPSVLTLGLLVAAYALASRVLFEVGPGFGLPTQLVFVPMLFIAPIGAVPLLVVAGLVAGELLVKARRGYPLERLLVLPANAWHAIGPAAVFLAWGVSMPKWSAWPIYIAALAAQFALDYASSALRGWLALGVSPKVHLRFAVWICGVDTALAPIGLVIAFACESYQYAFLLTLPLVALLAVFARQRRLRIDHALALGNAYRGTAFLLGDVIEANHAYTGSHSRDVVSLVLSVADELDVDANGRRDAEFAALLHDIGKLHIAGEILNKPASLNDEEWAIVRRHTIAGQEMLAKVGGILGEVGTIVRSCHEHYDGNGYPDGLAGEEIPLIARIITCCDAFSAMTSDRAYRLALSRDEALDELRAERGRHFDPVVVDALSRVLAHRATQAPAAG